MTQRKKSQSIGLLMIVVFSAVFLWALTAVVWPVPVVYANDPPDAVDDPVTTDEDTPVTIDVLANDTDPGDTLTVDSVGTPANGSTSTDEATVTYTPTLNFNGLDVFPYTIRDTGGLTDTATVTVTVQAVNDAPVNTVPGAQSTNEDTALTFSAGNQISISDVDAGSNPVEVTLTATNGTLTLSGTTGLTFSTGDGTADAAMVFIGTITNINTALDGMSFTPTPDYNGPASVQITTDDQGHTGLGGAKSDTDTVNITVQAVNDAPVADDDAYSVDEGYTLTVAASIGVLDNDTDVEDDTLEATLVSAPSHGTLTLNTDGSFTYVHDGTTSSDSFTYRAYDGTDYSNVATVTINIQLFDPVITAITVTSDSPTYFYNPGLDDTGGEVFFNSLDGEGGGQIITVTVSWTDANPYSLEGDGAFDDNPPPDTSADPFWTASYSIEENAPSQTTCVFTVTDKAGRTDTAVITFTQDNADPTVELTDVTNPGYNPDGDELDDDANWYNADDFIGGNWAFTSTTSDDGAGRDSCSAFWDHSNDTYDHTTGCTLDGDGSFSGVNNDDDGTVAVTVTLTDHVGNSASDLVVFNIDNTGPTVISPTISEFGGSDYLYVDDLAVFYGDDMTTPQNFKVQGYAEDPGVGPYQVTYSLIFEDQQPLPDNIIVSPHLWAGTYSVYTDDCCNGTINVTVTDRLGNATVQTFTYTRDITSPTLSGPFTIVENSPYLSATGTTVYYSHQMDTAQSFTVQGNAADNGAGLYRAIFSPAFGVTPPADYDPANWSGTYDDVESGDNGDGTITVKVTDNVSNWSEKTFNYVEDTTDPTVNLTSVTLPGYDENTDPLDTDGSNWYNADDFPGGNWTFASNTSDNGAGLASGSAFWDHSANQTDRSLNCGTDGDGTFSPISSDADGTVTVTVTLTDHVGNSASDNVVFNIDNTEPTITSPYISEDSDYLYRADDLITIYYGDMALTNFTVHGSSDDTEVGLDRAEFSDAFGAAPSDDDTPEAWEGTYYPNNNQNWGDGTITVAVYDWLDNAAYQTFNYFQDWVPPTVTVNCPALTSQPSWDVSWNGQDPSPASGVNHYDVRYKEGSDGPWQDWHTDTSLTEDTFGPDSPVPVQDGQTYYFQVWAEDNVSNEQYGECATTYYSGVKKVFLPLVMRPLCWGFETGDFAGWQHGGELAQSVSTAMPHSGSYSALLGRTNYPCDNVPVGSAWMSRTLTVPSSGSPTLSFWYRIYTQDYNPSEPWKYDYFAVYINGSDLVVKDANTTQEQGCSPTHDLGWKPVNFSLDAYKGQTIEIAFYNYNRDSTGKYPEWYNTYTYVDDVCVQ
jgi:hypothetical protein